MHLILPAKARQQRMFILLSSFKTAKADTHSKKIEKTHKITKKLQKITKTYMDIYGHSREVNVL
ncbi:MAG: hypothetical protein ACI9YE_002167, partial [Psychroserpens sp.]